MMDGSVMTISGVLYNLVLPKAIAMQPLGVFGYLVLDKFSKGDVSGRVGNGLKAKF